jgi:hypothetical protein
VVKLGDAMGGAAETLAQSLARAEATEAFAAILVDVLAARGVTDFRRGDLVTNASREARARALAAATFIAAVFGQDDCALIGAHDPLFQLTPSGHAALMALHHTAAWKRRYDQRDANDRPVARARGLWRRHIDEFAKALAALARRDFDATTVPVLGVQTSWLSGRTKWPDDRSALLEVAAQARRSARRALLIARAYADGAPDAKTKRLLLLAMRDAVLGHPVLWRLTEKQARQLLDLTDDAVNAELPPQPTFRDGELQHAWACRRVGVPVASQTAPFPVSAQNDQLVDLLSKCSMDEARQTEDECVYYVPICCDPLPDVRQHFDPRMALQAVSVERLLRATRAAAGQAATATEDVMLRVEFAPAYDDEARRRPLHPLLMRGRPKTDSEPHTLRAHVAPQTTDYSRGEDAAEDRVLTEKWRLWAESADAKVAYKFVLNVVGNVDNFTPYDTLTGADAAHEARRTLLFAIDRVYHALLYARMLHPTDPVTIDLDTTAMLVTPHPIQADAADPCWQGGGTVATITKAPKHATDFLDPSFTSKEASRRSNAAMVHAAYVVALALLPEEYAAGVQATVVSNDAQPAVPMDGLAAALGDVGVPAIPLGELAACALPLCFPGADA